MSWCWLSGLGLWTPGFSNLDAWHSDRGPDPSVVKPGAAFLPPMLRRRTSLLTRAMADACANATAAAPDLIQTAPLVFGSAYGETETLLELLALMHTGDGSLSPMRFAGSVHNTAAGYISIAAQNQGLVTSLADGFDTVAAGLLECQGLIADGFPAVILVVGDAAAPVPLVPPSAAFPPLAVAFCLTAKRLGPASTRALSPLHLDPTRPQDVDMAEPLSRNPCAGALALVETAHQRQPATVRLDLGRGAGWCVGVELA